MREFDKEKNDMNYINADYFETPSFIERIPESIKQPLGMAAGEAILLYLIPFFLATFRIESSGWAPVPYYYYVAEFSIGHFIFWYLVFWFAVTFIYIPKKAYKYVETVKKPSCALIAALVSPAVTAAACLFPDIRTEVTAGSMTGCLFFSAVPAFMAWIFGNGGYFEQKTGQDN